MPPTPRRSSAGQATLEYVAVIALVAGLLVIAAPALGARELPGRVIHSIRLAVCIVAGDVCRPGDAQAAGLNPCLEAGQTNGAKGSVTVESLELGGNLQFTGYRESDGAVTLVGGAGGSIGVSGGYGVEAGDGPMTLELGGDAAARLNVQAARAWRFADAAAAKRFLAALPASASDRRRWPVAWTSAEAGAEMAAGIGAAIPGVDLAGIAAAASSAAGARFTPAGVVTLYTRAAADAPELVLPMIPSIGGGRSSVMVEYTFDRAGPRELALRQIATTDGGNRMAETVVRLPLRTNSVNRFYARALTGVKPPWPPGAEARAIRAVIAQAHEMGTIEQSVYAVSDTSRGLSGSISAGAKYGAEFQTIRIDKALSDASAWTPGSGERDRFDCAGPS